ncbi:MAG TPA: HlyD family secretion protein, partial [Candidatus Staskawiczbacteria bacterium]|nr:HlyD family secretion protein [Candidatus Staskawiczbacteria bacterium]
RASSSKVYVEDAQIYAPTIGLYPKTAGTLQETFVNIGDTVKTNDPVARIGNELVKAKTDGVVLTIETGIGSSFSPQQAVATMINPSDLRVVAKTKEDKGLKFIKVGQEAYFTVDAFGSQEYYGVVDEISETSNDGDIVFSISDERQEKAFDIKVRFNTEKYSELKNGMSAKLWVIK